jgi:hypothetical protein
MAELDACKDLIDKLATTSFKNWTYEQLENAQALLADCYENHRDDLNERQLDDLEQILDDLASILDPQFRSDSDSD